MLFLPLFRMENVVFSSHIPPCLHKAINKMKRHGQAAVIEHDFFFPDRSGLFETGLSSTDETGQAIFCQQLPISFCFCLFCNGFS